MKKQLVFAALLAPMSLCSVQADSHADLAGVGDSLHASNAVLETEHGIHLNTDWCAPSSATNEQFVKAFKNWHDQHPESWQRLAVAGVMAALQTTWPCEKK